MTEKGIKVGSLLANEKPTAFTHTLNVLAPVSGEIVSINEAKNIQLSCGVWGEGIAIKTSTTRCHSPVEGVVESIDIVSQRYIIKAKSGLRLSIQIGPPLASQSFMGERFQIIKKQGNRVSQNDVLCLFDPLFIKQRINQCLCILTVLNRRGLKSILCGPVGTKLTADSIALSVYL